MGKKKITKIIALLGVLIISLCNLKNVEIIFASTINDDCNYIVDYNLDEAEKIAIMHIRSFIGKDDAQMWKDGVRIIERRALFDCNNNIEAYYFGLQDKNENPAGYVITGANSAEMPIIEFSKNGNSFINESVQYIDEGLGINYSNKIYYLKNMVYVCEVSDGKEYDYYDISTNSCPKVEETVLSTDSITEDNKVIWDNLIETSKGSNPPDNNEEFITDPWDYESGYSQNTNYTISNFTRNYCTTREFSQSSNCAPTAAVNMCLYWLGRGYDTLLNDSKYDTHERFYELMETNEHDLGTRDEDIADAYESYFDEIGINCNARLHYSTSEGQRVVDELSNNRAVNLIMHNHRRYKDHSVLALGYIQFKYNGYGYSTYIRIADGWTKDPDRYVWGSCVGTWNYVTVELN